MKGTYLDFLPLELVDYIYSFVLKVNQKELMNELSYQLDNKIIHPIENKSEYTLYEKKYYRLYNKLNSLYDNHKLYNVNVNRITYISWFFNRWLKKYYVDLYSNTIIYNSVILNLIHTYNILYNDIYDDNGIKKTISMLEYMDITSLSNFSVSVVI